VLIALGISLLIAMVKIIHWMQNVIANTGKPGVLEKYNGTKEQAEVSFLILFAVLAVGISAVVAGLYQVITGKRNTKLIIAMFVLILVLVMLGQSVLMGFIG